MKFYFLPIWFFSLQFWLYAPPLLDLSVPLSFPYRAFRVCFSSYLCYFIFVSHSQMFHQSTSWSVFPVLELFAYLMTIAFALTFWRACRLTLIYRNTLFVWNPVFFLGGGGVLILCPALLKYKATHSPQLLVFVHRHIHLRLGLWVAGLNMTDVDLYGAAIVA